MRKFLQWCLVAIVAIALIGAIAHQLLTKSTERTSQIAVSTLKQTLEEYQSNRADTPPVVTVSNPTSPAPVERLDLATLRLRWMGVLHKLSGLDDPCPINYDLDAAVIRHILGGWKGDLDPSVLEQVREYDACMKEIITEILLLCHQRTSPWDLFGPDMRSDSEEFQWGFSVASARLEIYIRNRAIEGDFVSAIEAIQALFDLSWIFLNRFAGQPPTKSKIIQRALATGTVDDATWQRLLDSMAARRDAPCLADDVAARTREMLAIYETWPQSVHFTFSEHPLLYSQNWAYRHVTTPLFNHDLETFGRAMDILVDLSKLPYYEAKPDLDQFYEDFDVEPSVNDLKIIRGNPAWYYVLELSRYHFPYEASYQSVIDTVTFAILLDRYKKNSGAYPETLEALAYDFGGDLPVCPLDGQPYVYERTDDQYQLEYRVMADPGSVAHHGMPALQTRTWFEMVETEAPRPDEP